MRLDEVLTAQALRSLRDTRIQTYLDQAAGFLATAYDRDGWLDSPTLRRDFARDCYDRSHAIGIHRRQAHLRFLSHNVIFGFAFEHSPIYRRALMRAGWLDSAGRFNPAPDVEAMTSFANRWAAMAQLECAQSDVSLSAYLDPARYGTALSQADALAILRDAWPDRSAIAAEPDLDAFAHFALANAAQQNMPADISAVFIILSLHLGAFFFSDARYTALAAVFLDTGLDEAARRDAVAAAINGLGDIASRTVGG